MALLPSAVNVTNALWGHDQRWQFRFQCARFGDERGHDHGRNCIGSVPRYLNHTLTLQTGSVLNGDALGSTSTGATNNLILQGNGTANNNFVGFQSLDVQANSSWFLNGNASVGAAAINGGLLLGDANHAGANHRRRDDKFQRRTGRPRHHHR